ncbi:MAG TPA: sensor histidine kinase [Candidatus Dormibacteraeota bacterium]|nr:sensor histidine kinase [Candidatus Dormibacteraeota bacterium]
MSWWAALTPLGQDAVLIVLLLGYGLITLGERPDLQLQSPTVVLLALTTVPLVLRRRWPTAVMVVVVAASIVAGPAGIRVLLGSILALLIATYAVGDLGSPMGRTLGAGCSAGVALAGLAGWLAEPGSERSVILVIGLAMATALLIGYHVRARRIYLAEVEARAARLEREREQAEELAAEQERARIARELHDVVAHHVSAIAIQAGSARAVRARDPTAAAEALDPIGAAARQALTELSRLLGVLRRGDAAPREPEPGLDQLDRLLDRARSAGHPVDLVISGRRRPLPSGVELSAYRIVQEAMTNVLKHARGAPVEVTLGFCDAELAIDVVDGGGATATPEAGGAGHGLIGMRERVAVFGGRLDAGPTAAGGFRVSARLPVEDR